MTAKIGQAGRAAAAAGTEIIAVNPADGPVSIEGYYDEAFSVPGLLAEIAKGDAAGVSAHIIACFDDTGLEAARCVSQAPFIGIGEAAFHLASMLGHRFTVVTTLSRSIAAIENNLLKYGLASRCARVRACEIPVLSLDDPTSNAATQIGAETELAKREDQARSGRTWLCRNGRVGRTTFGRPRATRVIAGVNSSRECGQAGGSIRRVGPQDVKDWRLCAATTKIVSWIFCTVRTPLDHF
jgi:Asp/Glu/hydantoin racemase